MKCRSTIFCSQAALLLVVLFSAGAAQNEIMRFQNRPAEPTINPENICKEYPELVSQQINICSKYPHATASAMQGVSLAIHECKRQFATSRWNCSHLDASVSGSHPILHRGYKETSFTHAITAAGILHQVATACAMGKISACSCEQSGKQGSKDQFKWSGCSHDLGFGAKYSRRFLQADGQDIQSLMQAHNSKIGRKAVIDQKSTKCKCHGLTSSCEIKTCWLATPDFRRVGDKLKSLYDESVKVDRTNSVEGKFIPDQRRKETAYASRTNQIIPSSAPSHRKLKKKLVFYEKSPTYCDNISELGLYGTEGRVCNSTSTGSDGCSALCCGRGYFTVLVTRVEKCNCKFHWCCYVICDKCTISEWVKVCK